MTRVSSMLLLVIFCGAAWSCQNARAEGIQQYSTAHGTLWIEHDPSAEGLYFDVPSSEVTYNVHILRRAADDYVTLYHGEPMKSPGKPGDSIKVARWTGSFPWQMPDARHFVIHGDLQDELSPLYSPIDAWGGAGNPMVVKGLPPDPYSYVFFLTLTDVNGDRKGNDFRHTLCQMRTRDFVRFDLLTSVGGTLQWKPIAPDTPIAWRRPWLLRDAEGQFICSRDPTVFHATQGLIGSICCHDRNYLFFYADRDADGKTYLFVRQTRSLLPTQEGRTGWSPARRISSPLMTGCVIRVAKTRDQSRWVVLYNGYRQTPQGLRQDLFLQCTGSLNVDGANGLAGIKWYGSRVGDLAVGTSYLKLTSGGGSFAQHCLMTDPYGALAVPDRDDHDEQVGGLLTWADFSRGVYGGHVYWAEWRVHPARAGE